MKKPSVRSLPLAGYKILHLASAASGHKSYWVRCDGCGSESVAYPWSWAGHGYIKCGSGEHALHWMFSDPTAEDLKNWDKGKPSA